MVMRRLNYSCRLEGVSAFSTGLATDDSTIHCRRCGRYPAAASYLPARCSWRGNAFSPKSIVERRRIRPAASIMRRVRRFPWKKVNR